MLLFLQSNYAHSETKKSFKHYISDRLVVGIRAEPVAGSKIIARLVSGDAVYLEEDGETGWSKISVNDKVGWIRSRYLVNAPVASELVKDLRKKNLNLIKELNNLKNETNKAKTVHGSAVKELEEIKSENFRLQKEVDFLKEISQQELELNDENINLKIQLKDLETKQENLSFKLEEIEQTQNRKWFMTGAGVISLGFLLGRFLRAPSLRRRNINSF